MTRVLFLTCHLPYPPLRRGRLRELELLKRLVKRFDVEVCAVTKTFADDVRHAAALEQKRPVAHLLSWARSSRC
jgi:hypothetical protein